MKIRPGSAEWKELVDTMIHDSWIFEGFRQGLGDRMCPAALAFAVRTTSGNGMRESVHQLVESLFDEIERRRLAGTLVPPEDVTSEVIPVGTIEEQQECGCPNCVKLRADQRAGMH